MLGLKLIHISKRGLGAYCSSKNLLWVLGHVSIWKYLSRDSYSHFEKKTAVMFKDDVSLIKCYVFVILVSSCLQVTFSKQYELTWGRFMQKYEADGQIENIRLDFENEQSQNVRIRLYVCTDVRVRTFIYAYACKGMQGCMCACICMCIICKYMN